MSSSLSAKKNWLITILVILCAAVGHLVISVSLYSLYAPGEIAGQPLPGATIAGIVLGVLCFPVPLLAAIDRVLPAALRIPEFAYPLVWGLSSVMWGLIIVLLWKWSQRRP